MPGIYSGILGSVKQALSSIGLPVVIRKRAILLEGDSLPLLIVSPSQESINLEAFSGIACYDYGVNITLISAGNRVYEPDVYTWLDLRENVRNQLYKVTLSGAVSVFDTMIILSPALEVVSGSTSNYDVAGITVTYRSLESRIA